MPHEPKKRHSRERQGKRRHAIKLTLTGTVACSNCGAQHLPHMICPACGFYKGQEMISQKAKKTI